MRSHAAPDQIFMANVTTLFSLTDKSSFIEISGWEGAL
jgi:hypothetical protein